MGGQRSVLLAPPPAGSPVSLGGTPSPRPSGGRPLDSLPAQWDLPRLVAAPADGSFPSATLAHRPLSFGCAQETSQVKAPQGAPGGLQSHRASAGSLSSLVPVLSAQEAVGSREAEAAGFLPSPRPGARRWPSCLLHRALCPGRPALPLGSALAAPPPPPPSVLPAASPFAPSPSFPGRPDACLPSPADRRDVPAALCLSWPASPPPGSARGAAPQDHGRHPGIPPRLLPQRPPYPLH